MRVQFNPTGQRPILNIDRINQSAQGRGSQGKSAERGIERRDKAELSKQGKFASLMENLMTQKQGIMKAKNELIGKTLESGDDMNDIEVQLEAFDEQLKNVETMIEKALLQEFEKEEEKEKNAAEDKSVKSPMTQEEAEVKKLNSIAVAAMDVEKAEITQSVKADKQNEARVLESEAKSNIRIDKEVKDRERRQNGQFGLKIGPNGKLDTGVIDSKLEKVRKLEAEHSQLTEFLGGNFEKINEEIATDVSKEVLAVDSDTASAEETKAEIMNEMDEYLRDGAEDSQNKQSGENAVME